MASASIFTYETEIPRVSSPWLRQLEEAKLAQSSESRDEFIASSVSGVHVDAAGHVTRLEAEPQDGPVEYKLHLLLRSRRNFTHMSTVSRIIGSTHSNNAKFNGPHSSKSVSETALTGVTPVSTQQSRQHRLEQLTTQLLWRLQQSSPHHASSATNVVLPSFPEALPELQAPRQLAKLPHGLEESQGALYEIGVSDDGTFVGLAEDEMRESLNNLRAMAACLGCVVEVQRMVEVGHCDWREEKLAGKESGQILRKGKLVVAEALVKPHLDHSSPPAFVDDMTDSLGRRASNVHATTQLRVAFTGATMSGKSSLLGALSTTTLDNGRGQSRLSMLKHRHEITSGITSSITQELIGYRQGDEGGIEVVNYATEGISSWIDMHAASSGDRLVFASDSAGHPRYRRTTVRGLVGWNPHWAILCIPADDEGDSSGRIGSTHSSSDMLGLAASNIDLSAAHLDLCLRLDLPLVVAVTKYDLASKTGLRLTLAKLLSIIKAAGRLPILLPVLSGGVAEKDLQTISAKKLAAVRDKTKQLCEDPTRFVPIVLTSAVQGAGLDALHALLHELPVPSSEASMLGSGDSDLTNSIFHIEDAYNKTADTRVVVVSGHLQRGSISVGDKLILGPCSATTEDSDDSDGQRRPSFSKGLVTARSFPGALKGTSSLIARSKLADQEWRYLRVISIRNLRLPVSTLHAGQVGTIGLQLAESDDLDILATLKIRKGMVMSNEPLKSTSTVVAMFRREDLGSLAVGSQVVLYIASIRAAARVLSARTPDPEEKNNRDSPLGTDTMSPSGDEPLEDDKGPIAGSITDHFLMVTLHFESAKEYVDVGSRVLVMPGGGLEAFVGAVTEVCE